MKDVKTEPRNGTFNGKKVKAVYVGTDGKAVKVWDKDQGFIRKELFETAIKAVRDDG